MKLARKAGLLRKPVELLEITYTGAYTDEIVEMSDGWYRLITMTTSGTLTVETPILAEVCVIGGGAGGGGGSGGAGAYAETATIRRLIGGSAVIGAGGLASGAGGISSFSGVSVAAVSGRHGGTGGGYQFLTGEGTGDGEGKYPFGDSSFFPLPHCGGGAAGGYRNGTTRFRGGNGGTNGGSGDDATSVATDDLAIGGTGGISGGGNGGNVVSSRDGSAASYYGSGGGGYGYYKPSGTAYHGTDGAGYQGIIYLRIPLNQAA